MPVYEGGKQITYSIEEVMDEASEYTATVDDPVKAEEGKNISLGVENSYETKTIKISATKTWKDSNDQDGKRANVKAKVTLYKTVDGVKTKVDGPVDVATKDGEIKAWENMPVYEGGKQITYSIEEVMDEASEYDKKVDPAVTAEEDKDISFGVENSYETKKIDISATKTWTDANNQDGKRANVEAKVTLYKTVDGVKTPVDGPIDVATQDGQIKAWSDMPVYEGGKQIIYSVEEVMGNKSEYDSEVDDPVTAEEDKDISFGVENSYEPKTIDVSATKTWTDANDQDGKRANVKAKVTLYKTVDGVKTKVDGPVDVATKDGEIKAWENMPVYEGGKQITYSIEEVMDEASEYDKKVDPAVTAEEDENIDFAVENSYEPKTISISAAKTWTDENDQDGKRANVEAKVTLYKTVNGEKTKVDGPVDVATEDGEIKTWSDMPVYEGGKKITYSVEEVMSDKSEYDSEVDDPVTAEEDTDIDFAVENSYTPETVKVNGTKAWDYKGYDDIPEDLRPTEVTINLMADGKTIDEAGINVPEDYVSSQTTTADDNWAFEFTELPKYKDHGTKINYTVTEDTVDGFSPVYKNVEESTDESGNVTYTLDVTNEVIVKERADGTELKIHKTDGTVGLEGVTFTLKPEEGSQAKPIEATTDKDGYAKIDIPVAEGWLGTDERDQDVYNFELTEEEPDGYNPAGPWTVTVKQDGETSYEIVEVKDDAGEATGETYFDRFIKWITDNVAPTGETVTFDGETLTLDITNTHVKTEVDVEKVWEGEDARYDIRPDSIKVHLMAQEGDGEAKEVDSAELSDENEWKYTFEDLDKYYYDEAGKKVGEIKYTVEEDEVTGYEVSYKESTVEDDSANKEHSKWTITNEMKFGDVKVTKDLKTYESSSEKATFVYSVKATVKVGKKNVTVYDGVVTLDFTTATTASAVIEKLPAGAVVEVEELYSGAVYDLKTGPDWDAEDQTIVADDMIGVAFSNDYNGEITQGHGILNEYEAKDGDWVHLEQKTNSNSGAGDEPAPEQGN